MKYNNKKRRNFFVTSLKFCKFRQNGRKSRMFFMKTSLIWTYSQIFRKFSFWENLRLFLKSMMLNWVIIFTQERALWQTFTYSKSTMETLKKVWIMFKVYNKNTRKLSTVYHSISWCFCCYFWTSKCLLGPTLSIYKRWNNILLQLLTDIQKS